MNVLTVNFPQRKQLELKIATHIDPLDITVLNSQLIENDYWIKLKIQWSASKSQEVQFRVPQRYSRTWLFYDNSGWGMTATGEPGEELYAWRGSTQEPTLKTNQEFIVGSGFAEKYKRNLPK